MKQVILTLCIAVMAIQGSAQANEHLSNLLPPTQVNEHLLPNINNLRDLGSGHSSWRNIYLDSFIYLDKTKFISNAGIQSTFIGTQAGNSNTSSYNSALGYRALYLNKNGSNNTATGANALRSNTGGSYNTGTGSFALYRNTTGNYNTALGANALSANLSGVGNTATGSSTLISNSTGSRNTAFGMEALYSNTTGTSNTAAGFWALASNRTGSQNVAIGNKALYSSVDDLGNVAIGDSALYKFNRPPTGSELDIVHEMLVAVGQHALTNNTTGYSNTATGARTLFSNTTGNSNTANGAEALRLNTTGTCNTAVGNSALRVNTTGSNNTAIGCNANVSVGNLSNSTAVGFGAIATASNQVMLGNSSVTSVRTSGSFVSTSDGRFKNNRKENVPGLSFIKELKPVTYNYDIRKLNDYLEKGENKPGDLAKNSECCKTEHEDAIAKKENKLYSGFFAQEVEVAANKLGYDFSGVYKPQNDKDAYGLSYGEFVVPLVKAVQELSSENDSLKTEINNIKTELDELKNLFLSIKQSSVIKSNSNVNGDYSKVSLDQNIPNPFTKTTTIRYNLTERYSSAKMIITDQSGKVLKEINITGRGKGSVNIDATVFSSGAYNYSLYVNGRLISSKKLIIAK